MSDIFNPFLARLGLLVFGNGFNVLALYMLAKLFKKTGLEYTISLTTQRAIKSVLIIAIIVIFIPAVIKFSGITNFVHQDYLLAISSLGDIISLWFMIPIIFTMLSMRGGLLLTPWVYLSLMMISWLVMDFIYFWINTDWIFYPQSAALIFMIFAGLTYKQISSSQKGEKNGST
jgi:hypothetical protein